MLCQYTLTIYGFLIIENRKYHQEMEEALPPEIRGRGEKRIVIRTKERCAMPLTQAQQHRNLTTWGMRNMFALSAG